MEIKIYTIKLNPPRWVRNLIVYVALPVGALVGGALVVRAGVALTSFAPNQPIKSAEVNANFTALNTAVTALQTASPVLYGVRGSVATLVNGSEVVAAASCGKAGRIVTGFCVTNPVQAIGGATGLWKYGAFDSLVGTGQTTADPVLNSLWICDVKAGNGVTAQAYAVCMNAP